MNRHHEQDAGWLHRARPGKPDDQAEHGHFSGNEEHGSAQTIPAPAGIAIFIPGQIRQRSNHLST